MASNKRPRSILAACSFTVLLLFAAFASTGCEGDDATWVLSLKPSFTDSDLEWDPQLVGTWSSDDSSLKMTFAEGEKRAYKLLKPISCAWVLIGSSTSSRPANYLPVSSFRCISCALTPSLAWNCVKIPSISPS